MASNDTAAMNKAMEQLTQAQHRAAESMYRQAGPAGQGGGAGTGDAPGSAGTGDGPSDVIDAEVVDEEKK